MKVDLATALQFAHHANNERNWKLLRTHHVDEESKFLDRRLAEEQAALRQVVAGTPTTDTSVHAA
jgi:hypothetical protein